MTPRPTTASRPVPLRMKEACERAAMSEWTLRNAIRKGELTAIRVGRLVRVLDRDLYDWLERRRVVDGDS